MKKITVSDIKGKKNKEKITVLTAYDYSFAKIIDSCNVDILLVGDSLGMVSLGYETTLPVTMDEMIHHTKAVSRAVKNAMVIADMPFLSYHVSIEETVKNAGRFMKETDASGVKIEGGADVTPEISKLVKAGIPVMGHIGLTPQYVNQIGGFKVQGKDVEQIKSLINDAVELEKAGVFSIVLECIPKEVAGMITKKINIPTIGIGAGPECDGQVLVSYDMIGLFDNFTPKFVKQYCILSDTVKSAIGTFIKEVNSGEFPKEEHSFKVNKDIIKQVEQMQ